MTRERPLLCSYLDARDTLCDEPAVARVEYTQTLDRVEGPRGNVEFTTTRAVSLHRCKLHVREWRDVLTTPTALAAELTISDVN